jgi:hypothetical protein
VKIKLAAKTFIYRTNAIPSYVNKNDVVRILEGKNPGMKILRAERDVWKDRAQFNDRWSIRCNSQTKDLEFRAEEFYFNIQSLNATYQPRRPNATYNNGSSTVIAYALLLSHNTQRTPQVRRKGRKSRLPH